jgi:AcrR family transcriptional regulator
MGRPTKAEARDTRRQILDAALDLFSEGSYFGTSMRQIARAVGVRESALYHHFPSKDAILKALVEEYGERRIDPLTHADATTLARAGVERFLRTFVLNVLEIWATPRERKFIRLILAEGPRVTAHGALDFPAFIERNVNMLATLFGELMGRGLMRRRHQETAAIEFMAPVMVLRMRFMVMNPAAVNMKRVKALADEHVTWFWEAMKPRK